jgi:hypothetical protein
MKRIVIALTLSLMAMACSSSDDGGGGSGNTDAAVLSAPSNNSECTTGTEVSATESKVTFQWAAAPDAETYFVYIKNLDTQGAFLQYNAGTGTSYDITLLKGTPYSWYVSAKKTAGNTAVSQTWKFYNAGDGITNYAPFPAEAVYPVMSASVYGPVTLEWTGSDLDDDIDGYKVYLDTNTSPVTLKGTVSNPTLPNVALTTGTYYWKVVTSDEAGNETASPVYQFKVL